MKKAKPTQQIICGTDFSIHAAEAADVAAALARRHLDTLVLAHVIDHAAYASGGPVAAQIEGFARARLAREADRLRATGVEVREKILAGRPEQQLTELAGQPGARLVVVASLGHIAPSRLLLGSVAERTAEAAVVPTLVVRGSRALLPWARGEAPLRVFLAGDFSASSEAACRWAGKLREFGPCEFIVGNADWPPEEHLRLGVPGPVALAENRPEITRILERDLRERVGKLLGQSPAKVLVEATWGRAELQLLQMAGAERADLIVTGSHQRHGWSRLWHGSVSRGLLHDAPMSVACVPQLVTATSVAGSGEAPVAPVEYRRVLAATDGSPLGDRAVPHALAAVRAGGTVTLLQVVPPLELPGPLVPHYERRRPTPRAHAKAIATARQHLQALVPDAGGASGIEVKVEIVEHADAATAIYQAAERCGADLICLGTHGRSGISKALLGSVASKVMSLTTRPVLTVRAA